jgi:hypothetical protein
MNLLIRRGLVKTLLAAACKLDDFNVHGVLGKTSLVADGCSKVLE